MTLSEEIRDNIYYNYDVVQLVKEITLYHGFCIAIGLFLF